MLGEPPASRRLQSVLPREGPHEGAHGVEPRRLQDKDELVPGGLAAPVLFWWRESGPLALERLPVLVTDTNCHHDFTA